MHVVDVLALAGMEHGVIKLVNRLDRERVAPMICCLSLQRPETRGVLDPGVPVFELRKRPGRDLSVVRRLAALLRRQRIEVIHSHNWRTFFYAVVAAELARVPIRVHGHHGQEARTVPRRQVRLSRWLAGRVTRLVAVSTSLGRDIVEHWGVPPERVTVIPNGVDLDAFAHPGPGDAVHEALGLPPDARVVLSIGGLRPVKDYPALLRAFARVHRERPEARLILVGGEGPPGTRRDLEREAVSLGIGQAVTFAGVRRDIAELLHLCDVYVNSSIFEGMSNTILEAMAAARPVVATDVGGTPGLVRDGVSGYLVPSGDDRRLAEGILRLLDDPGLAKAMGAAGRLQAERRHTMAAMITGYRDVYEDLAYRRRLAERQPVREGIKTLISGGLRWCGALRIGRALAPSRLTILMYHRVLPVREALEYAVPAMTMGRDAFEAQMAHLARHYDVMGLSEATRALERGRVPRRAVAVTFDDGYRDTYEHAWPILRNYGIPAALFVVTGAVDRQVRPWWDVVADALSRLCPDPGSLIERGLLPGWLTRRLDGPGRDDGCGRLVPEVIHHLNQVGRAERDHVVRVLQDSAAEPPGAHADLMLSWDQVREMHRGGMEFGAHTVTHAFLDELDETAVRQEVEGSVARLGAELAAPVSLFAYPRGRVSAGVREVLARSGIRAAVTTRPGANGPGSDLLALNRLDAGYCRLATGFDRGVFDAELAGWFNRVRHA
jgi:sugar transferase (PEP-CTERM/EpsH1 system associated)